jgi:hypothetical protein
MLAAGVKCLMAAGPAWHLQLIQPRGPDVPAEALMFPACAGGITAAVQHIDRQPVTHQQYSSEHAEDVYVYCSCYMQHSMLLVTGCLHAACCPSVNIQGIRLSALSQL